jgi:hypothetical protein
MGDAAVLEVGQLSAARGAARTRAARDGHGHAQSIVDRRQIAVRLRSASGRARFARLQASLKVEDPRCRVRIDGIVLTQVPQLIDAAAPVGAAVAHTLEIEVPVSEPPGVLATEITWLADTDS